MVRGPIHNQRDSDFAANGAANILVDPRPDRWRKPWLATFRRKNNVINEVTIGGARRKPRFPSPPFGGSLVLNHIPGVPLRSTPGFNSAAPLRPSAVIPRCHCGGVNSPMTMARLPQRRRRAGIKPFATNRAAEIFMNPRANRCRNPRFPVFRGKHNVVEQIAMGGTRSERPFRRPFPGALTFLNRILGSFAPLHCRLYAVAPSALGRTAPDAALEGRRKNELEVGVERSMATPANPWPRMPLLSPLLGCSPWPKSIQRRRRVGIKPGVQRSVTPGKCLPEFPKPLKGVTER